MGLAQLPAPIAAESLGSGQVEAVLPEFAPTVPGLFLYYPSRRQVLPKLRAFIDHMKRHAAETREGAICSS
jgi:DNA-binding transcriptional LysR family regulator